MTPVILLAADPHDADRWVNRARRDGAPIGAVHPVHPQAPPQPDTWPAGARLVRTDLWPYDQRIVSALRTHQARHGLIDPIGLLGPLTPLVRGRRPVGPTVPRELDGMAKGPRRKQR